MASHSKLTIEQKLRAGHVRRWHIVAVSREQTIADHQYRVALITEEILRVLGLFNWKNSVTLAAMEWARVHDLPEVVLGDIPTNGKAAYRENGGAIALIEAEKAIDYDIALLHESVHNADEQLLAGLIVKVADLAEAANYCGIFGVGDHAKAVWNGLRTETLRALEVLINYEDWIMERDRALTDLIGPIINSRGQQ